MHLPERNDFTHTHTHISCYIENIKQSFSINNTVVAQDSSLIHCDEWWASEDWWSIFSCRVASWFIQALASAMTDEQALSAERFFFSPKCDKYQVWQVLKPTSTERTLYIKTHTCTHTHIIFILSFVNELRASEIV